MGLRFLYKKYLQKVCGGQRDGFVMKSECCDYLTKKKVFEWRWYCLLTRMVREDPENHTGWKHKW